MQRRRLLAAMALLGLPTASLAQSGNKTECYPRGTPEGIDVYANFTTKAEGEPPVLGDISDIYQTRADFPPSFGITGGLPARCELNAGLPDRKVLLRLVVPGYRGPKPFQITFMEPGLKPKTRLVVKGEDLKVDHFQYLGLTPLPESYDGELFSIELGGTTTSTPEHLRLAQLLMDGQWIAYHCSFLMPGNGSSTFGRDMRFVNALERRAVALRLIREQTARFQRGECGLKEVRCYLTTAAVEVVGLDDTCWELQTLRRFRDTILSRTEHGQALVENYYTLAPDMIMSIARRKDAKKQWLICYFTGILPSALAAHLKLNSIALWLYKAMTRRLQRLTGL
jgi:hypothetical protein